MGGYSKLFGSIVTSSIWCDDDFVLRVWIAMLATCDSQGLVEGSIPGFANLARVPIEQMERAIEILKSPDPHSRTKAEEGRRVREVEGGWQIINYLNYRNKLQEKQGSRASDMRHSRAKKCNALHEDVTCYTTLHDVTNAAYASAYMGESNSTPTMGKEEGDIPFDGEGAE